MGQLQAINFLDYFLSSLDCSHMTDPVTLFLVEELDEAEPLTSFSSLPSHVVINILLRVMQDASKDRMLVPDLRLLIMDLGSVSAEMKACVSSSLSMLREVNLDCGIDHRRSQGQLVPMVDDALLLRMGRKCAKLESLRLRCSEEVTETGLMAIAEGSSRTLTKLVILSCNRIGSGRFLSEAESSLTSLRHLELKWAYALLPYHLRPILPGLVVLNVHGCELLDDGLFINEPQSQSADDTRPLAIAPPSPLSLPFLEELDLAYTLATGASLQHLAKFAPRLKKLNLGGRYFNIITSSKITEAAEETFSEARPDVVITHS